MANIFTSEAKTALFSRSGDSTLSLNAFYGVIGGMTTLGIAALALAANACVDWRPGLGALIVVALLPFIGVFLSFRRDLPFKLVGFGLIMVPLGMLMGPSIGMANAIDPTIVTKAATATACITAVFSLSSFAFPKFYSKIGGVLFMALVGLVVVRLVGLFVPAINAFGPIDYAAGLLFSLYIGYDLWRASQMQRTVSNAVEVAISLGLDIANLFQTMLRIFLRARD